MAINAYVSVHGIGGSNGPRASIHDPLVRTLSARGDFGRAKQVTKRVFPLLMLVLPSLALAQLNYTTNNLNTINITGYTGAAGELNIPATINGLPVTSIASNAFGGNYTLTSVTMTNNVTTIEFGAFAYCRSLTNAVIGGVTNIGGSAFQGCSILSNVTITNSVTSIGDSAFLYCSGLTNVTMGYGVTTIQQNAFGNAFRLPTVTIPDSVTSIGYYAFGGDPALTNLTIPASVTNLEAASFSGTGLVAMIVDSNNPAFSSVGGVLFNKSLTALIVYPPGNSGTSYTIPNSVTTIGSYVFFGALALTNVTIGTNVTSIGDFAFKQNFNLRSVTIPDSVTNIGNWAFAQGVSLTTVTIGSGVVNIGDAAFLQCANLMQVYFRGNAPTIAAGAFGSDNAYLFYLPGTLGWGPNINIPPTTLALWLPRIQGEGATFGVRSDLFGFNVSWASGMAVTVEACTNLAKPTWLALQTNTLVGGSFHFGDSDWTNYPGRFYRIRSP